MIRHALVPLDGSHAAERVLPYVVAVARAFDAGVHLLQVLEGGSDPGMDAVAWEMHRSQADDYLESKVAQLEADGLEVTWEVGEGRATVAILDCARRLQADLTVLGTHGHGGPTEFPMGSTAKLFLSRVPGSVLIVPTVGERGGRLIGATGLRRVLVPLDGSRRSEWAISMVQRLVRGGGTSVVIAHVAPVPELPCLDVPLAPEELEMQGRVTDRNLRAIQTRAMAIRQAFARDDVPVESRVEASLNPGRRLLQVSDEEDPDLIVVCAHGGGADTREWGKPFGHVTECLVTHGTRPILVLQDLVGRESTERWAARRRATLPAKAAPGPGTQAR